MTIDPSGTVELVLGTMSAGQGHETSFAQLISEWLGVGPDQVRLVTGDTDRVQAGGGSASARSMRLGSWVIAKAADEIDEKGLQIAAAMLEVAEQDVEFVQHGFRVPGTDRSVGLFEAAAAAAGNDLPPGLRGPLIGICDQAMSIPSFGLPRPTRDNGLPALFSTQLAAARTDSRRKRPALACFSASLKSSDGGRARSAAPNVARRPACRSTTSAERRTRDELPDRVRFHQQCRPAGTSYGAP
jgi:hypothetical protein